MTELEVSQIEDLPDGGGCASAAPEDAQFISQAETLGEAPSPSLSDIEEGIGPDVQPMGQGKTIKAGSCYYQQGNDNPHKTNQNREVSVHGWWTYIKGTCPAKANVDIYLQALWHNPHGTYAWLTVGSNSMDLKPGTGQSGRRVSGRLTCATQVRTSFRGLTDVDLPGIIDPSGREVSPEVSLTCSPAGPHT